MRAMICNFPSVFANEYERIKPEKCAVEYPPRAFRAFSRPFFSPSIVSASTGDDTDTHATPWIKFTHLSGDSCKKKREKDTRRDVPEEEDTCAVPRTKLLCCVKENIV